MNKYSYKYEIADYIESLGYEEPVKGTMRIDEVIRQCQVFRLPHIEALPTIKDYKEFYDFMKSPYIHYLIEIPYEDHWMFIQVNDYRHGIEEIHKEIEQKTGEKIEEVKPQILCILLSNKGGLHIWNDMIIDLDETGYEVTHRLENIGEEENRRFAWTIFEFMVAINTPNIKQVMVNPPKFLNQKRAKKGKQLLAGFKYLDLPKPAYISESSGKGNQKRMHWRRGHIRRLKDKTTWIRAALIGQGNFVDKTYRIKENGAKK